MPYSLGENKVKQMEIAIQYRANRLQTLGLGFWSGDCIIKGSCKLLFE